MGLDDFKEKDSDAVPVQELQRDSPPSGYDSWSEYEPQPQDWDENQVWAVGECHEDELDGNDMIIIADKDQKDTFIRSVFFVSIKDMV